MLKKVKSLIASYSVSRLQHIQNALQSTQRRLQIVQRRLISSPTSAVYSSLTPVDDADKDGIYSDALSWALSNCRSRDIKNIAITGPYGSGKSSILKTFQRENAEKYKFLNISLATFKEERTVTGEGQDPDDKTKDLQLAKPDDQDRLRLIELSILQQIFYREKPSDIPDSRFKRIVGLGSLEIIMRSFCIIVLGFSVAFIANKGFLGFSFKNLPNYEVWERTGRWISLAIIIICAWYFIGKTMRLLSKVRLKKITIQDADFEIDENINKSILNHHIDELLYFFEVTKHNVVIIEDLDRFQQTEIFTKLREINSLLNKSKRIEKEIVFIYAVRDDMFRENDRTKFFDFIVPVIPVINSSNSSQKLLEKRRDQNYLWTDDIIEDLAIFIDDMRLLHNITNEFYLYSKKLSPELDQNKLLAMLVYKNIFPEDFTKISEERGSLFSAIYEKTKYIKKVEDEIDEKIIKRDEAIEGLQKLKIKDVCDLNALYLFKLIEGLHGFVAFSINGERKSFSEMQESENFEYILSGAASYEYISTNYSYPRTNGIKKLSKEIESSVDPERTYSQRKQEITAWNDGRIEHLREEIQSLKKQKSKVRGMSVRELLSNSDMQILSSKQGKLISILLRNGYIGEDYSDYISLFYEGSLTKGDYGFILNVKSGRSSGFDYPIVKISEVIRRINILDFNKGYILNYRLVDHLLSDTTMEAYTEAIMTQLADGSQTSSSFIDGMIDSSSSIDKFFRLLSHHWPSIWVFIKEKSNYTTEKVSKYFNLILANSDIIDILEISKKSDFINYILSREDFMAILSDESRTEDILKALSIKFIKLDEQKISNRLVNFLDNYDYYEINIEMISLIVKRIGHFDQTKFDKSNYSFILNSNCSRLISYIDKNIDVYLSNVYLSLPHNVSEEEVSYVRLLNHDEVDDDILRDVIKVVNTSITKISTIEFNHIRDMLFEYERVVPSWRNIFEHHLDENGSFLEVVLKYIDKPDVMTDLSKLRNELNDISKEGNNSFIKTLLELDKMSDETYGLMLDAITQSFVDYSFENLSNDKTKSLIEHGLVSFNLESYDLMALRHPDLLGIFIASNKESFLKSLDNYPISRSVVHYVLKSIHFTHTEKGYFINNIEESLIVSSEKNLELLGRLLTEGITFNLTNSVVQALLSESSLDSQERVQIYNSKYSQVSDITSFLNSLDAPYSNIAIRGQKPLLAKNGWNLRLAEILQSQNYISSFRDDSRGIRINTFSK